MACRRSVFRLLTELWKLEAQGLDTPHTPVPAKSPQPRAGSSAAVTGVARETPEEVPYKPSAVVYNGTAGALVVFRLLRTYVEKSLVGIDRKSTRLNSSHLGISYA